MANEPLADNAADLLRNLGGAIREGAFSILGIDGADGIGKSPLARYLALELRAACIELDLYADEFLPRFRSDDLRRIVGEAERDVARAQGDAFYRERGEQARFPCPSRADYHPDLDARIVYHVPEEGELPGIGL